MLYAVSLHPYIFYLMKGHLGYPKSVTVLVMCHCGWGNMYPTFRMIMQDAIKGGNQKVHVNESELRTQALRMTTIFA